MSKAIQVGVTDALIMVDTQRDFCPGGALAVTDGDEVVPVLNRLAGLIPHVAATRDWHPPQHCSFVAQGGLWPPHCVQGTPGAEYHAQLNLEQVDLHVIKADRETVESFDNFAGTPDLARWLRERGVTRVFVGGLATEYCVLATVLGAIDHGFAAVAVTDAMRPVELQPGDATRAQQSMRAAGAMLVSSDHIVAT